MGAAQAKVILEKLASRMRRATKTASCVVLRDGISVSAILDEFLSYFSFSSTEHCPFHSRACGRS